MTSQSTAITPDPRTDSRKMAPIPSQHRTLVTAIGSVSLLAVAGCGPGELAGNETSEPTAPPPKQGLANIDPCTILKPNEVSELALREPQFDDAIPNQPACDYLGEPFGLAVSRNTTETVESSAKKSVWAKFDRIEVNGRSAAQTITKGSTQARICSTMFNAGDGYIDVVARETNPGDLDECAESHKIAEMIEPRMPE